MQNLIYKQLTHRSVRDLAWALLSPGLFDELGDAAPIELLQEDYIDADDLIVDWLLSIDNSPEPLLEYIEQRSRTRVGIYFEQLLGFYFKNHPRFQLLQQNLQVQGKHRTLGEFDFIVHDKRNNHYLHIESAVKFYLGGYDSSLLKGNIQRYDWHNWIGPNKKDSLSLKMHSMINKQLHLSKTDEGHKLLNELHIPAEQLQTRLLLRGRFFSSNNTQPLFANQQVSQFRWQRLNEFKTTKQKELFIILPRIFWLAELNTQDIATINNTLSKEEVLQVVESDRLKGISTWKVICFDKDNNEKERFFIADI